MISRVIFTIYYFFYFSLSLELLYLCVIPFVFLVFLSVCLPVFSAPVSSSHCMSVELRFSRIFFLFLYFYNYLITVMFLCVNSLSFFLSLSLILPHVRSYLFRLFFDLYVAMEFLSVVLFLAVFLFLNLFIWNSVLLIS